MHTPYEGSSTEDKAVLHHNGSSAPRAYAVHAHHFPNVGWQLAHLMNGAYLNGYKQCQADMRAALGLKE